VRLSPAAAQRRLGRVERIHPRVQLQAPALIGVEPSTWKRVHTRASQRRHPHGPPVVGPRRGRAGLPRAAPPPPQCCRRAASLAAVRRAARQCCSRVAAQARGSTRLRTALPRTPRASPRPPHGAKASEWPASAGLRAAMAGAARAVPRPALAPRPPRTGENGCTTVRWRRAPACRRAHPHRAVEEASGAARRSTEPLVAPGLSTASAHGGLIQQQPDG
jgi:hypothetical protein